MVRRSDERTAAIRGSHPEPRRKGTPSGLSNRSSASCSTACTDRYGCWFRRASAESSANGLSKELSAKRLGPRRPVRQTPSTASSLPDRIASTKAW